MAESPGSWNLLTASLAVCDLSQPRRVWAFLVLQGLVRDSEDEREVFLRFVRDEQARRPMPGPTLPYRIAESLATAGIASPAGLVADPWGRGAADRLESVASWPARHPTRPWWKVW